MNAQHAQLEQQAQDTEVQDVAEEIGGIMEAAFDLLIERRDRQYAAAIEPLDAERDTLEQESSAIGEARQNLQQLLPAKAREAQRVADALMLAGRHEEATAKLAEAEEAANAPAAMTNRQREISARCEAIEQEKKAIARRIFGSWYPDAQRVIRAAEHGLLVTLLDGVEDSMNDYQARTGEPLIKLSHRTNLTADERAPYLNLRRMSLWTRKSAAPATFPATVPTLLHRSHTVSYRDDGGAGRDRTDA